MLSLYLLYCDQLYREIHKNLYHFILKFIKHTNYIKLNQIYMKNLRNSKQLTRDVMLWFLWRHLFSSIVLVVKPPAHSQIVCYLVDLELVVITQRIFLIEYILSKPTIVWVIDRKQLGILLSENIRQVVVDDVWNCLLNSPKETGKCYGTYQRTAKKAKLWPCNNWRSQINGKMLGTDNGSKLIKGWGRIFFSKHEYGAVWICRFTKV